jgi:hypothetical protein
MAKRRKNRTHTKGAGAEVEEVRFALTLGDKCVSDNVGFAGQGSQVVRDQGVCFAALVVMYADSMVVWGSHEKRLAACQRYAKGYGAGNRQSTTSTSFTRLCELCADPILQERGAARLRDYLVMAGPLGVSHMMIFTLTEAANVHLRIARIPAGPTLTFRVERYSLMK